MTDDDNQLSIVPEKTLPSSRLHNSRYAASRWWPCQQADVTGTGTVMSKSLRNIPPAFASRWRIMILFEG